MDTQFTFPPHQRPIPRNTPVKTPASAGGTERQSNALRASVLDAALELGITGDNSLVAAWMFDNSLKEEDEDEEPVASPGLTNSSSTASDEGGAHFSRYPPTPPELGLSSNFLPNSNNNNNNNNNSNNNGNTSNSYHNQFFRPGGKPVAGWDDPGAAAEASASGGGVGVGVSFQGVPSVSQPPSTPSRKLKKKKSKVNVGDGYESDGGYLSEGGVALSKKALKKEEKARLKQEKKDKEEERKKKKGTAKQQDDLVTAPWASAGGPLERDPSNSSSTKKSSSKKDKGDGGYETDGGYISTGGTPKKSKGRFFKLGKKSSRTDLKADSASMVEEVPPMPKEHLPLPIAERFASPSANGVFSTPSASFDSARPSTQTQPFQLPSSGGLELPSLDTSQPFFPEASTTARSPPRQSSPPLQPSQSILSPNFHASPSPSPIPPPFVSYQEAIARHDPRSSMSSSGHGHGSISSSSGHSHGPAGRGNSLTPTGPLTKSGSPTSSAPPSSLTISYPLTRNAPSSSSIISATSTIVPATPTPTTTPPTAYNPSSTGTLTRTNSHYGAMTPATLDVPPRKFAPHNLPRLDIHSRQGTGTASPAQLSPSSPYVLVTPSPISAPSQLPGGQLRPRNPPTNGFGPRTAPPSTSNDPNTVTHNLTNTYGSGGRLSPNPMIRARRLSPLLPPEGHPDATPLPSPNVLAYYDIPPPSPPPQGPLPSVPVPGGAKDTSPPTSSGLRPREGMTSPNNLGVAQPQRGRVSPFPTQPVMVAPRPMYGTESSSGHIQHVPGLEARVRQGGAGARYREPSAAFGGGYAVGGAPGGMRREGLDHSLSPPPPRQRLPLREQYQPQVKSISPPRQPRNRVHFQSGSEEIPEPTRMHYQHQIQQRSPPLASSYNFQRRPSQGSSNHSHGYDDDREDEDEEYNDRVSGAAEIQDVLNRFVENSGGEESASSNDHGSQPLPRRRSFEATLRETRPSQPPSSTNPSSTVDVEAPGERDTMYTWADDAGGNRESRWSGSIYSRISIMDEDKSGSTRDRFIQRVEAMVKAKEKANGGEAPPVPSLQEGLANARSWNKF